MKTYQHVNVALSEMDGNVFFLIVGMRKALRKAGVANEEIETASHYVSSATSYDDALTRIGQLVNVS